MKEAAPEEAPTYSEEYQKKLIISKLAHETYALMKLNQVKRLPYSEYIQELQAFAQTMDPNLGAENNKKAINNTNSSTKTTVEAVDTIEGFPINDYGFVLRKKWLELSNEKKEKINKKRLEIKKDSKKKFAKNPKYQGTPRNSTNSKATKDKDKNKDKSGKKEATRKSDQNIKSLGINDDAAKKVIQYLEKKFNAVKYSKHRTVSFNADTLQKMVNLTDSESCDHYSIVDSGTDTGLKGSTSIFIEHTFRCANVNGFDSNGTKAKEFTYWNLRHSSVEFSRRNCDPLGK